VESDVRANAPALSVALPTLEGFESLRRTVTCLAQQDIAHAIELLIMAPAGKDVVVDPSLAKSFHSTRVLPVAFGTGTGDARAAAVREARAPIIAFAEDHSFPQEGWASALVDAHREPHAAVGPAVHNANPATLVSWADLLMGYGPWLAPTTSGPREHLPGHNSSYKREPLLALGAQLPDLIEAETTLHWKLRAEGHSLFLDQRARVAHTNFDALPLWLWISYHTGRVFAATRALEWPWWRRAAFAAASPLIPLVRLRRHLGQARAVGWSFARLAGLTPTLLAGLVANGIGEGVGTVTGVGQSAAKLVAWEFNRNERRGKRSVPA
jgi:hypothetical protein